MEPATIAALGAGAAMAATNTISMANMGKRSRRIARRALDIQEKQFNDTLAYNERQADLNRQFIEDYYNKYDSPEAMMKQYQQAGLNPFSYSGQTGSLASSMGNNPMADPNAAMAPYDNLKSIADSYQQQGNAQASQVQSMLSTVLANIDAIEKLKGVELDNEGKRIQNQQAASGLDVFNTPLSTSDFSDMSNLDPSWSEQFYQTHNRAPTFGDLFYQAMYKQGFRRLYESGSGAGSDTQQNPLMRALAQYYMSHPSTVTDNFGQNPYFNGDFGKKVYDKAFDVSWEDLTRQLSDSKYTSWKNDWNYRLQSKGINPEGNDLLNTAVRLIYGNGGEQFVNDLSSVLSDMFGKADQGVNLLRKLYKTSYQK